MNKIVYGSICMLLSIILLVAIPQVDAVQLEDYNEAITRVSSHTSSDIIAEGMFFENTAIIEFTNDSDYNIESFTFWLGTGYNFESFKTEIGWSGKKTPEGTIIFTSSSHLKVNESVKFGVKTSDPNLGINWMASDNNGNQVGIGRTSESTEPVIEEPIIDTTINGVFEESTFRIIPEKPKVGSTIRITGENFGTSQQFSFYIDTKKIGTFLSDENGNFTTTMKIPDEQTADRVNFMVIDSNGNEKIVSLRLGDNDNRVPEREDDKLTVRGLPSVLFRGDTLDISGTAQPGSAVTASIKNPIGDTINTRIAEVDSSGEWELPESITISLDAAFGTYTAEISDGKEIILRTWEIKSAKIIIIEPSKLRFEPGEIMRFSGTALPNNSIEFVMEDPLGKEVFSERMDTNNSGEVEFEYETHHSSTEGTYTLIAKQDGSREFIFVGLGQTPIVPINLEFDKLNYKSNETAIITMSGNASDTVSLLIIDQSDKPKPEINVTLGPDGIGTHLLKLSGYKSGVYTAVISKGSSQSTEIFTVGLKISVGEVKSTPTRVDYHPGEAILILGETDPNSLLTITLSDPDDNVIRTKDTFSDKDGRISDDTFRIPSDAKSGAWTINTKSGAHFDMTKINVISVNEGMIILLEDRDFLQLESGRGIDIKVLGARATQTVIIEIFSPTDERIGKLEVRSTKIGEAIGLWEVPRNIEPGIYTIKARDAFNNAEITYELK